MNTEYINQEERCFDVGDELTDGDVFIIVTWRDDENFNAVKVRTDDACGEIGQTYSDMRINDACWHKTGRHVDLTEILGKK